MPRNRGVMDLRWEKWKSVLRFGTWNVRTHYLSGAALTLVKEAERFKLGILSLQEIRWNEGTSMEIRKLQYFTDNVITVEKEAVALLYRTV